MAGIITGTLIGIFTIIGVILGYCLAKQQNPLKKAIEIAKSMKKQYGEPFVVRPNEMEAEKKQKKEVEEKELIDIEDIKKEL